MYWSFVVYQFLVEERVNERLREARKYDVAARAAADQNALGVSRGGLFGRVIHVLADRVFQGLPFS